MQDKQAMIHPDALAAELGVKPGTLRWWRHMGCGPDFIRYTERVVRYRREDVDRWLEERYAESK